MFSRNTFVLVAVLILGSTRGILCQVAEASLPASIAAPEGSGITANPAASSVEHWDKLALRDNNLHSASPISGEIDTFPGFTRELLRVQWRDADPIDLYIVRPAGIAKPPFIVYLYGYPGEAVRFLNNSLCKSVTKNGFAAVGFSSMLTGQRYHDVPMKEWFVSDLEKSLAGTTHDVQMVLNYLTARGDFDMTRVGIFGEGSGGTIALLTASVDPRVDAVDLLNPWGDWPTWLAASQLIPDAERPDFLKPEFLKSVAPFDPVNVLPKLAHPPLRLQQNLWDDAKTPAVSRERIASALPASAELAQYKNEQEYYEKVGNNGKMLDWMYAHLQPSSPEGESSSRKKP